MSLTAIQPFSQGEGCVRSMLRAVNSLEWTNNIPRICYIFSSGLHPCLGLWILHGRFSIYAKVHRRSVEVSSLKIHCILCKCDSTSYRSLQSQLHTSQATAHFTSHCILYKCDHISHRSLQSQQTLCVLSWLLEVLHILLFLWISPRVVPLSTVNSS